MIEQTGIPKQTIHYYIQQGLLPRPRKLGSNSADYNHEHVDKILLIKSLQEHYFLPLSVIKKVLKKYKRGSGGQDVLKVKAEYFRPLEQLLAGSLRGEEPFLQETGIRQERLKMYEDWGVITPNTDEEGEKTYSYEDQVIGRIIAEYRKIGLTGELGFEPDILKKIVDAFKEIIKAAGDDFFETAKKTMSMEEIRETSKLGTEITAMLYYHLYIKLARDERVRALERLSMEDSENAA